MARNRYFYYDHERDRYAEAKPNRPGPVAQAIVVAALTLGGTLGVQSLTEPPKAQIVASETLMAERTALQQQLALTRVRLRTFERRINELADRDEHLYRTLLQAPSISEETRQVGVGGADPNATLPSGLTAASASVVREATATADQIERMLNLQAASYRQLQPMADHYEASLGELPALMPTAGQVLSGFGMRRHPILGVVQLHSGVDIVVPVGTSVVAPADGVVKSAGPMGSYGNVVEIQHPASGYVTRFAHLSRPLVRRGQKVLRGDKIALSGNTGRSTGPHVHYEVRTADNQPIDPAPFMAPGLTPAEFLRLRAQVDPAASPVSLD
ncbi:MAG: M23 family metallopeptidase [Rhodothermales bacterium]|nr:M23 family metallopeptidase [Rhodothermales bacterium]